MSFSNTANLSYAAGETVKYINAQRGLAESVGGPKLKTIGVYSPRRDDIVDLDNTSNTGNVFSVATTTNSSIIISANTNTKFATIVNEAANTLYIAYDTVANSTHYTYAIPALGTWEMSAARIWQGAIAGFLGSGSGAARCTVTF